MRQENRESANALELSGASLIARSATVEQANAQGRFNAVCRDANGDLRWQDEFPNLWTTEGKTYALQTFFNGSGYTAAFYCGLVSSVGYTAFAITDTAAGINGGGGQQWYEAVDATHNPQYSQSVRQTLTFAAAAANAITNGASPAVFTIATTAGTVKGCFNSTSSVKGGTAGKLISVGLFTGGDRPVQIGDTLSVTWSANL